jgi:hypothetical protein
MNFFDQVSVLREATSGKLDHRIRKMVVIAQEIVTLPDGETIKKVDRCYINSGINHEAYEVGWITNESVADCMICFKKFGLYRRKHHCRLCGILICNTCSLHRVEIRDKKEGRDGSRACNYCVQSLSDNKIDYVQLLRSSHSLKRESNQVSEEEEEKDDDDDDDDDSNNVKMRAVSENIYQARDGRLNPSLPLFDSLTSTGEKKNSRLGRNEVVKKHKTVIEAIHKLSNFNGLLIPKYVTIDNRSKQNLIIIIRPDPNSRQIAKISANIALSTVRAGVELATKVSIPAAQVVNAGESVEIPVLTNRVLLTVASEKTLAGKHEIYRSEKPLHKGYTWVAKDEYLRGFDVVDSIRDLLESSK